MAGFVQKSAEVLPAIVLWGSKDPLAKVRKWLISSYKESMFSNVCFRAIWVKSGKLKSSEEKNWEKLSHQVTMSFSFLHLIG